MLRSGMLIKKLASRNVKLFSDTPLPKSMKYERHLWTAPMYNYENNLFQKHGNKVGGFFSI